MNVLIARFIIIIEHFLMIENCYNIFNIANLKAIQANVVTRGKIF